MHYTMVQTMSDIQKADPQLRRKMVIIAITSAIVGAGLVIVFRIFTSSIILWIAEDHSKTLLRAKLFFSLSILFTSIPLIGFAAYFWKLGRLITFYERFPPPNTRVIMDTRIIRGDAARKRGKVVQLFSVLLIVIAIELLLSFWKISVSIK